MFTPYQNYVTKALDQIQATQAEHTQMLNLILGKENQLKADLTSLTAQVTANTTVEASAVTLIQGIAAQLAAAIASNDPAALDALQAQLNTSATALAAAITANTAASPTAPAASKS